MEEFDNLVVRSRKLRVPLPTLENRISSLAASDERKKAELVSHAKAAGIVVHHKVLDLIDDFLRVKTRYGRPKERALYADMRREAFLERLFTKRALSFRSRHDISLLRDGTKPRGNHWLSVGELEEGDIKLEDYLSYDEMQISAMLGASTPTFFINNGARQNRAKVCPETSSFESYGVIVGLVGARFEKKGKMDFQHMITPAGCKVLATYSMSCAMQLKANLTLQERELLKIWEKFYFNACPGRSRDNTFLSAFGARCQREDQFVLLPNVDSQYLNVTRYKNRINILAETLLAEANYQGETHGKSVFLQIVGFGLGKWKIHKKQDYWFVEAFLEAIEGSHLRNVNVAHFSSLPDHVSRYFAARFPTKSSKAGNLVEIQFSKRNTADKVERGLLLVSTFAWNSNAFPGNDYWLGKLSGSSDPAAACCSTIAKLLNPDVNSFYENIRVY